MGFFKKLIVDLKEEKRLKKEGFIYDLYLENKKERETWSDQPQTLEQFIEGNHNLVRLYQLQKKKGRYEQKTKKSETKKIKSFEEGKPS